MSAAGGRMGVRATLAVRVRGIVAVALLGMLAGFAWGIADEPTYRATATVVLAKAPGDPDKGDLKLARYADIARGSDVAATAAANLGGDIPGADLLADLTVVPAPNDVALRFSTTADEPDFAVAAANGYAGALVEVVNGDESGSPLELGAEAVLPDGPSENRSAPLWALIGLGVGLFVALVGAAIRGWSGRSQRPDAAAAKPRRDVPDRLEDILDAPLLASIADPEDGIGMGPRGRLGVGEPVASDYADLAAELEFNDPDGLRTLAVLAPSGGEDAISVAIGVSVAASRAGLRVLLVEADLAAPTLADLLRIKPSPGLGDYLGGSVGPRDVLRNVRVDGPATERSSFVCVPAGERDGAIPRSVAGGRFDDLVERLPKVYDLVVFLAPPVLSGDEAIHVARAVEGVLVVSPAADPETTTELHRAAGKLAGATVLGAVRTGT